MSYPKSMRDAGNSRHHVFMTDSGLEKLRQMHETKEILELDADYDYIAKDGGENWLLFPDVESTSTFRHTWILARRRRPRAPSSLARLCPDIV